MTNTTIHKTIGWGVTSGSHMAHFWKSSLLGLIALSYCGMTADPRLIYPANHDERCPVCSLMLSMHKQDPETGGATLTNPDDETPKAE